MFKDARIWVVTLGAIALGLVALIGRDVLLARAQPAAPPRLATVSLGTVRTVVSGTGTVVPGSQVSLNFRVAGQLKEIDVRAGDHVAMGQVLARLDARTQQNALDQANAGLQGARASLQAALAPLTPEQVAQLQHSLAAAQQAYNDTVASVNITNQQDAATLAADQQLVLTDQQQLAQDQAQLAADQAAAAPAVAADQQQLRNDQATLVADQAALDSSVAFQAHQQQLATDQSKLALDQATWSSDGCANASPPLPAKCQTDFDAIQSDQRAITADQQLLVQDRASVTADQARVSADLARLAQDQPKVNADQTLVNQDQAKLNSDQARVIADQNRQQLDVAGGQTRINQAQAQVTAAQDALTVQSQAKPNGVAAARAQVAASEAQVAAAQINLDATTLTAPIKGVVAAIFGQVGENIGTGGGGTQQAPGTVAPQPAAGSGTGTGSSAFMVLSDVDSLQMVAPFAESDAAKLKADQEVSLSFDAVPGVALNGRVLALASNATVVSNVVNYYATIVLSQSDPRLRPGMTANAAVTVTKADGVLTVPNAAVRRQGVAATVVVYSNGRTVPTEVEVGLVGDTTTEIRSGLKEGDRIVMPTLRAQPGTQPTIRTGGGFFGPGGGGR